MLRESLGAAARLPSNLQPHAIELLQLSVGPRDQLGRVVEVGGRHCTHSWDLAFGPISTCFPVLCQLAPGWPKRCGSSLSAGKAKTCTES